MAGTSEWPDFAKTTPNFTLLTMSQRSNMKKIANEANIQLALHAIQQDATLTVPRAAAIYKVPERTLRRRRDGTPSRGDCTANSMKLTSTEETVIVQHILKLDKQGYPPRLADVEDMANSLLAERHQPPVGKN